MRLRQVALGNLVEQRTADAMAALHASEGTVLPRSEAAVVAAAAKSAAVRRVAAFDEPLTLDEGAPSAMDIWLEAGKPKQSMKLQALAEQYASGE